MLSFPHAGEPPAFEEKGPFVFRQDYKRVNVHWEQDGTLVTFQEKYVHRFDSGKSKGQVEDPVRIINPAWAGIVTK